MLGAIIYAALRRVDESETLLRLLGELAPGIVPAIILCHGIRQPPSAPPRPAKLS